jgi:hypothetical protein
LILFMVVTSNAMKDKSVQGEPVVIGFNDWACLTIPRWTVK